MGLVCDVCLPACMHACMPFAPTTVSMHRPVLTPRYLPLPALCRLTADQQVALALRQGWVGGRKHTFQLIGERMGGMSSECRLLSAVGCLLFAVCCLLFAVCCLPLAPPWRAEGQGVARARTFAWPALPAECRLTAGWLH